MKSKTMIIFSLFFSVILYSQKYSTKNGEIHFVASVPLFEDVDAKNNSTVIVFNTDNGGIASIAMVKNFKFKVSLMEEHFNENYAESAKYPKTTFTGLVNNFKKEELSKTPKEYIITGKLNFHGVENQVQSKAKIYLKDNQILIVGKFVVKPKDYKIVIPSVVSKKIAENVEVEYKFELNKQ